MDKAKAPEHVLMYFLCSSAVEVPSSSYLMSRYGCLCVPTKISFGGDAAGWTLVQFIDGMHGVSMTLPLNWVACCMRGWISPVAATWGEYKIGTLS